MSHYDTLGVSPDADESEIKKAYRKKMSENHPDKFPGDEEKVDISKKITVAYGVLKDPDAKAHYDKTGVDADDPEAEAIGMVLDYYRRLLSEYSLSCSVNYLLLIKDLIGNDIETVKENKMQILKEIKMFNKIKSKIKTDGRTNIFVSFVDEQLENLDGALIQNSSMFNGLRLAKKIVARYRYEGVDLSGFNTELKTGNSKY